MQNFRAFPHADEAADFSARIFLVCIPHWRLVSKDEIAAQRKWETYDERASREVFRSNWIVPSVSEEDKNFFYRPFFKVSNER